MQNTFKLNQTRGSVMNQVEDLRNLSERAKHKSEQETRPAKMEIFTFKWRALNQTNIHKRFD